MTEDPSISDIERARVREADLLLARRAARGDRAALHAVVHRHADALFRVARGLCPTAADAEDAVQEALISIFRGIGSFDGRASLLTWMSKILVRRIRKMARKWQRHRLTTVPLEEARDRDAGPSRTPSHVDSRLDLAAALPNLPQEFREIIVLRELQGMSYAEIARTLDVPEGTVESRIHRARLKLWEQLVAYRT